MNSLLAIQQSLLLPILVFAPTLPYSRILESHKTQWSVKIEGAKFTHRMILAEIWNYQLILEILYIECEMILIARIPYEANTA